MIKKLIAGVLISIVANASQSALALEAKYEVNYLFVDTKVDNANYEPNAILLKYVIPYTANIELEGALGFGTGEETEHLKYLSTTPYEQHLSLTDFAGVYLKAHALIEPTVWAVGRLGIVRMEYNVTSSISGIEPDGKFSDFGLSYGVGLSFNLFDNGSIVLGFDQYPDVKSNNATISSAAISLGYQSSF